MQTRYLALDGIRGLAAIYVAVLHAPQWFGEWTPDNGFLAVDLFFALSGFVLAASYGGRFGKGLTPWIFLKMRIIRLYPLYALGLLLSLALLLLAMASQGRITEFTAPGWAALPYALFMLPMPSHDPSSTLYPLNIPAWSLMFEIIINIVFAATFMFWTKRNLALVMLVAGSLLLLIDARGDGGHNWSTLYFGVLRVSYSFPAGVLVYLLLADGWKLPRLPALACLAAFPLLILIPSANVALFCVLIGFPLLVAFAASVELPRRLATPSILLGSASYALYVLHMPLYSFVKACLEKLHLQVSPLPFGILTVLAVLLLSLLAVRYADVPLRRFLSEQLLQKRSSRTTEPALLQVK